MQWWHLFFSYTGIPVQGDLNVTTSVTKGTIPVLILSVRFAPMMAICVQMITCNGARGVSDTPTTRHPVMMVMPVPRQIPVQAVLVLADQRLTVMTVTCVRMIPVNPATGCVNTDIVHTVTLSPDPLNLGSPGEQGVMTALIEESSVASGGRNSQFCGDL